MMIWKGFGGKLMPNQDTIPAIACRDREKPHVAFQKKGENYTLKGLNA
jgi:hypothetical protein